LLQLTFFNLAQNICICTTSLASAN